MSLRLHTLQGETASACVISIMLSTACLLTPIHPRHSQIPFYLDISCLLSHELLHCIGGKEIDRKIVLISSCLMANMDSTFRKYLLDAADRCVSVEFVFLEQNSNQFSDFSDSVNKFRGQICDLENCSFNTYLPDGLVFNGLVKRWVGELTTDDIMQWQAHLVFQRSLACSINEIFCKLCNSSNYITDVFNPCKKSMKVDEHTLLSKESWRSWISHCPVSSAVYLNVTERTNLASLSECVMVGKPYIVIPSDSMETDTTDESDKCQLNNSLFQGLCRALYSQNQGLVCWTSCNIEAMRETTFHYYYILQPSDNGMLLLRRLAGAEEILPFPDLSQYESSVAEEIDNYVQSCLQEVELRDYNPVQHIGGFHQKINELVLESSQFGPVNSDITNTATECQDIPSVQPSLATNVPTLQPRISPVTQDHENESEIVDLTQQWEQLVDGSTPKITSMPSKPSSPEKFLSEEWEKLIVGGGMTMHSAPSEHNADDSRTSPIVTQRPLDTRTSKILERLGHPQQRISKVTSPTVLSNITTNAGNMTESRLSAQTNKVLTTTSCLMKPTFHRLKRKQR
ncbi:hypothetical protein RND81_02G044000 [Saponaria officinalis]|uniref:Uncharacterized protein n=1 Tax=Saponaria officinalis TaxID=3572 RepID=A0AAW1MKI6_SAPOF